MINNFLKLINTTFLMATMVFCHLVQMGTSMTDCSH